MNIVQDETSELLVGGFRASNSLPHYFATVALRVTTMLQSMYSVEYGLSFVRWRLIAILGRESPQSITSLAEMTALDQVTVSRAVDYLVRNDFIRKDIDDTDKRRFALRLSPKGVEVYGKIIPLVEAADQAMSSALTESEEIVFRSLMKKVANRSAEIFPTGCDWEIVLKQYGPHSDALPQMPTSSDSDQDIVL